MYKAPESTKVNLYCIRKLPEVLTQDLGFLASYNEIISSYFPAMQEQLTAFPSYNIIITG